MFVLKSRDAIVTFWLLVNIVELYCAKQCRKIDKATRLKLNANKALGTLSDLRSNKGVKVALNDVKESFKNLKTPRI